MIGEDVPAARSEWRENQRRFSARRARLRKANATAAFAGAITVLIFFVFYFVRIIVDGDELGVELSMGLRERATI